MGTHLEVAGQRADEARSHRAGVGSQLAVHQRLVLSALVTAVSLWIRVVEVIPDSRLR